MKKKQIIRCAFVAGLALLMAGCYEDKGNYGYHDINEVGIVIPETSVRLPKEGKTAEVEIVPELSQTITQGENRLSFLWEKGPKGIYQSSDYEVCGEERNCHLTITSEDTEDFTIRLTVTDENLGTKWYKTSIVKMVKPFASTWFVLQEENGKGKLGAVDGEHDAAVLLMDVYTEEAGTPFPLQGNPQQLEAYHQYGISHFLPGVSVTIKPALYITTDQDYLVVDGATLKDNWTANEMILYPVWAEQKLDRSIGRLHVSAAGEIVSDYGKPYFSFLDGRSIYFRMGYKEAVTNTEVELTHMIEYSYGTRNLCYDRLNHRFLYFMVDMTSTMGDVYTYIYNWTRYARNPERDYYTRSPKSFDYLGRGENSQFNPDNIAEISPNIDVVGMARTQNFAVAFASTGGTNLQALMFESSGGATDLIPLQLPDGIQAADMHFAASYGYENIVFAAAKNRVYKIDFGRSNPTFTLVHELEDTNAVIAGLKFQNTELLYYGTIPQNYVLGAAVTMLPQGGAIVEMRLTPSGDLVREENATYEYKGFGKIVDFAYSYQD